MIGKDFMTYEDKVITAGTRIVLMGDAGMAGTDTAEFFILKHDMKESELSDEAWAFAKDHAESYGRYPAGEYTEEEVEADPDSYTENIEGWYEIYDPEEHDGLRVGHDTSWNEL